jgi:DNA-directed RNA polymerase subunit M/transcription elongation factor TFIIS
MEPIHECPRCGYQAKRKDTLLSHLFRKNPCKPTKPDVTIQELRNGIQQPPQHTCKHCGAEGSRQAVHRAW